MNTVVANTNRATQRAHATYKNKSEISEALYLIRPYINVSTYKFLNHFLYTDGAGVTQAKITEICKLAGISTGVYSMIVKHEIENTFDQALIIKTPAPMKYDNKRKKRVKASEFKSLLPLAVIKKLVAKKKADEEQQLNDYWSQFDIETDIEIDIESESAIPCESKDEGTFSTQQNSTFRENLLEKSLKDIVNKNVNKQQENINKLILEYMNKGLSKKVCFKVVSEIMPNGEIPTYIQNIGGYIRGALENTLYKSQLKKRLINFEERFEQTSGDGNRIPFYNWLVG